MNFVKLTAGLVAFTCVLLIVAGCNKRAGSHGEHSGHALVSGDQGRKAADGGAAKDPEADIREARAQLSAEDRRLVEEQEWCVVMKESRLGEMGPPLKLNVKGHPVFVCCKGCKRKAEADPDKTLAKVEELKAKSKAEKDTKK